MEELKTVIDLTPLSDEDISKGNINLADLWMVRDDLNNVYGPYDTQTLKVYISKFQQLFEKTNAYNLQTEQWEKTFNVPHFQRRKDSPNGQSTSLHEDKFTIFLNKQQSGPYTKLDIQNFLDNGQLKPDSPISIDAGENWMKIFEHYAFDRRSQMSNQELPFVPEQSVLDYMAQTKEEILKAKAQDDAIVELAFLGHQKSHPEDNRSSTTEETLEKPSFKFGKGIKLAFVSVLFIGMAIAGSLELLKKIGEGESQNFSDLSKPAQQKTAQKHTTTKRIQRQPSAKPVQRVKPKSFVRKASKSKVVQPRRFPKRASKRTIVNEPPMDRFEQDNEILDVNDPEIQEEITRQLAGEENLEGDAYENFPEDEYDYPEERLDDFESDEDPIMHNDDDY